MSSAIGNIAPKSTYLFDYLSDEAVVSSLTLYHINKYFVEASIIY